MKKPQRGWETSEIEIVREGMAKGLRRKQIAAMLPGRSVASIIGLSRRIREGLPVDGIQATEARRAVIRELWPTQTAYADVLARLNALPGPPIANRRAVSQIASKMGVFRPRNYAGRQGFTRTTWSDERLALLRECRAKGMIGRDILPLVNALPGRAIKSPEWVTEAAKSYGIPFIPAPKPPKPPKAERAPKPPRVAKPKAERKPRLPKAPKQLKFKPAPVETAAVAPRYAGWREISDWWFAQTGKREWAPNLSEVNARRREQGRPPFAVMRAGQFVIPMMRAS